MQGQWQEYLRRKMVLEMGILKVGGSGWLICVCLCWLWMFSTEPIALCKAGVLWVTLTLTECPLPALLSAACVCSSLPWGWSCPTGAAWSHQCIVGILLFWIEGCLSWPPAHTCTLNRLCGLEGTLQIILFHPSGTPAPSPVFLWDSPGGLFVLSVITTWFPLWLLALHQVTCPYKACCCHGSLMYLRAFSEESC